MVSDEFLFLSPQFLYERILSKCCFRNMVTNFAYKTFKSLLKGQFEKFVSKHYHNFYKNFLKKIEHYFQWINNYDISMTLITNQPLQIISEQFFPNKSSFYFKHNNIPVSNYRYAFQRNAGTNPFLIASFLNC